VLIVEGDSAHPPGRRPSIVQRVADNGSTNRGGQRCRLPVLLFKRDHAAVQEGDEFKRRGD
jgi:hypothetical protein